MVLNLLPFCILAAGAFPVIDPLDLAPLHLYYCGNEQLLQYPCDECIAKPSSSILSSMNLATLASNSASRVMAWRQLLHTRLAVAMGRLGNTWSMGPSDSAVHGHVSVRASAWRPWSGLK